MSDDPPIRRNCDVMRYLGRPWSPEYDCADLAERGYEVTGVYRWRGRS